MAAPSATSSVVESSPSEASLYDAIYESRGADVAVYLALALPSPGPVLELGAGTGRLLVPLLSRGIDAWGLELAPDMLMAGHRRLATIGAEEQCGRLLKGDMRTFCLRERFSLIVVACNTISLMLEDADLLATFRSARSHLEPNGVLAFDLSVVEGHSWFRKPYTWTGQTEAVWVDGVAAVTTETGRLDPESRLCTVQRDFELVDGRQAQTQTTTRQRSVPNVLKLLDAAGLAPVGDLIDEQGKPYGEDSTVVYVRAMAR